VLEMQPGLGRSERQARLEELLAEFNLEEFRNTNSRTLSGGERRRVEIARVLATRPSFILLDEPFAAIDPKVKEQLKKVIEQLKAKGIGILITDHDVLSTLAITDRAYILFEGEVKTSGTSDEISEDPIARKYYLGENSDLSELLRTAAVRRRGLK
jgi:lipopolysaccharide export system ATP-binding protein